MQPAVSSPVMLSSLERMAFFLNLDVGAGRVDGKNADTPDQRRARRSLNQWMLVVSDSIRQFCAGREFLIEERTQYFDVRAGDREFFPRDVPIVSITSIKSDFTGQFTGSEFTVDESTYHIGKTGNTVEFWLPIIFGGPRALQVVFKGGLAYDVSKSYFTVKDVSGGTNIAAGVYAQGVGSESIGKVVSYNDTTKVLVLESIDGVFIPEALTFSASIYGQDIFGTVATIDTVDKRALVEAYPVIPRALEWESRFMQKHEFDSEVEGVNKQGTERRKLTAENPVYLLQPETQNMLQPFRRYLMGS